MRNMCLLEVVLVCTGWCQAPPSAETLSAESLTERFYREYQDAMTTPHTRDTTRYDLPPVSIERPSGESISVARMAHKVPKQAKRALQQASKLCDAGDYQQSARRLEEAVRLDPQFAQAYTGLGVVYTHMGRLSDAKQALDRSLELDPNSSQPHYVLALVFVSAGDQIHAEQSIRRALALAQTSPPAHLVLGYLLAGHDETREAGIAHLQYAARTMPYAREILRDMRESATGGK